MRYLAKKFQRKCLSKREINTRAYKKTKKVTSYHADALYPEKQPEFHAEKSLVTKIGKSNQKHIYTGYRQADRQAGRQSG